MNNRTIYFNGVQLAYKSTEQLIQLIDEKVKTITIKTNDLFDKDRVETNSLLKLKRQLTEHLFQWNNVELGDTVVYKEAVGK
jgi:isocitrate dehydrogenase kinase/phosphatase